MERTQRRWWTWSVTLIASLVVLAALASALFQVAIMAVPEYREDIAQLVSRVAGRTVDIGGVSLGWHGPSPQLEVSSAVVYADDQITPALSTQTLILRFSLFRLLVGNTMPSVVEVSGLRLFLQVDQNGHFHLRGVDSAGGPTPVWKLDALLRQLTRFERFRLRDCLLTVEDARLGQRPLRFVVDDATLDASSRAIEASTHLVMPESIGGAATIDVALNGLDKSSDQWHGNWDLEAEDFLMLPWLGKRLLPGASLSLSGASLRLDGDIQGQKVTRVHGDFSADGLAGNGPDGPLHLSAISLGMDLQRIADGWSATVNPVHIVGPKGAWPASRINARWLARGDGHSLDVDAGFLRIGDLAPWWGLFATSHQWLARLGGDLQHLSLRVQQSASSPLTYTLRSDLSQIALHAPARPEQDPDNFDVSFDGLSGSVWATESSGRLQLRDTPFTVSYPRFIGAPMPLDHIQGDVSWQREANGLRLEWPNMVYEMAGGQGHGSLALWLPPEHDDQRIKLSLDFNASDVTRLKPFMPLRWPDSLRDWLAHAAKHGRVVDGKLDMDGPLIGIPYADGEGVFDLSLDIADGSLAYLPDWPDLTNLGATARFHNNSVRIDIDQAELSGNRISWAKLSMKDFRDPVLFLTGAVRGDASQFYDFVRGSPLLAERLSGLVNHTEAKGPAQIQTTLTIPLKDAEQTRVDGTLKLENAQMAIDGLDDPVTGINGQLHFDNDGVSADVLSASMFGINASAWIRQLGPGQSELDAMMRFDPGRSDIGPGKLLPGWLRERLHGESTWSLSLPLAGDPELRLASSLQGTRIDLPDPIGKTAAASQPLTVRLGTSDGTPLRIRMEQPDLLAGELDFVSGAQGAGLQLQNAAFQVGQGAEVPDRIPGDSGIHIDGHLPELDVVSWGQAVTDITSEADVPGASVAAAAPAEPELPVHVDIDADKLEMGILEVGGARVGVQPRSPGWALTLSGDGAEGEINFQPAPDAGFIGRLSHLQILKKQADDDVAPAPDAAVQAAAVHLPPLDPASWPWVDLQVADLRIADTHIGAMKLQTEHVPGGQRISVAQIKGDQSDFSATGQWTLDHGATDAALDINLETKEADRLLDAFSYVPTISAEHAKLEGHFTWQDPKWRPDWRAGNGQLSMTIRDGQLHVVEPGAGRVLGLLNFYALPRRLALDFSDVTSSGLAFDKIRGDFNFSNGVARTDNLRVDGPSVSMDVRGDVNLLQRSYDQRITVYPDVSSGLTLGALLLAGPAGAALAYVAQEVLDKPLDQASQFSYRVSGSWDNPQIQRVSDGGSKAADGKLAAPQGAATAPAPAATGTLAPAPTTGAEEPAATSEPAVAPTQDGSQTVTPEAESEPESESGGNTGQPSDTGNAPDAASTAPPVP